MREWSGIFPFVPFHLHKFGYQPENTQNYTWFISQPDIHTSKQIE